MLKNISFIIFLLHTLIFSNCFDGFTEIDGNCYWPSDLEVLAEFIDNSSLDISPINLGVQEWTDGRLSYLCVSEFDIHACQTDYQLSGEIPESISTLIGLEDLRLIGNNLSGQIPENIGNLTNLHYLDLNYNQLSGNIPESIGDLLEITEMYISYNEISNEIPESICDLVNLKYLYLGSNSLSGDLPECLGDLDKIEVLILDGNEFTGVIPSSIGMMENLSYINISNNNLIGGIPESIGELPNLNFIYLNANILTDQIPQNICNLDINWTNPIVSSISNNYFCLQPFPDCIQEFIGSQSCEWNISGDSNLNEEVDILDVIILIEFILDIISPDQFQIIVSDIHSNNKLDVLDLVGLINIILQ